MAQKMFLHENDVLQYGYVSVNVLKCVCIATTMRSAVEFSWDHLKYHSNALAHTYRDIGMVFINAISN